MPPCRIHGHGPNRVIAIHGWFNDNAAFDAMLAGFDPERFSVALPDARGYGSRRSFEGPYNVATIAADVLSLADILDWPAFSVIGHSMGGKAALRIAIDAADRVRNIVGITPVWAGQAPFDPSTLAFFRRAAGDLETRIAILDRTTGERLPISWLRQCAERSDAVSDPTAFAAYFESWSGDDFAAAAAAIQCPVLVVAGAYDQGVPEALIRSTWLSSISNVRLAVIAEAGHYPADETPLLLASEITGFLDPALAR